MFKKKTKTEGKEYFKYLIKDQTRYEHERNQFRRIWGKMQNLLNEEKIDELQIDYYIEILTEEVKYSSLCEMLRGYIESRDIRYIFAFYFMDKTIFGYSTDERNLIEIDIRENHLISCPSNEMKCRSMRKVFIDNNTPFKNDANHTVAYFDGLNIACTQNGKHSLSVASFVGNGKVKAVDFDVTKCFPYIEANEDLSFSYNIAALEELWKSTGRPKGLEESSLKCRYYGTDYRLLLIYKIRQEQWKRNLEKYAKTDDAKI